VTVFFPISASSSRSSPAGYACASLRQGGRACVRLNSVLPAGTVLLAPTSSKAAHAWHVLMRAAGAGGVRQFNGIETEVQCACSAVSPFSSTSPRLAPSAQLIWLASRARRIHHCTAWSLSLPACGIASSRKPSSLSPLLPSLLPSLLSSCTSRCPTLSLSCALCRARRT
jgi:hypothetical protein